MQQTKNKSANIRSLNFDQLPIKRIFAVSLLSYFLIAIELFLLTTYRMSALPYAAQSLCADEPDVYTACVNELIKIMLFGAQWSAVRFSIYFFTLTPIIYLLMRKHKGQTTSSMLVLTITLLLIIAATLSPPWIELASTATSLLLAGLLITKARHAKS